MEWLFHIAIDNMETAQKLKKEAYKGNYETGFSEITFNFSEGRQLESCVFKKNKPPSVRTVQLKKKK